MMRFICSFYDLPAPIYPFLPFPNISWESKQTACLLSASAMRTTDCETIHHCTGMLLRTLMYPEVGKRKCKQTRLTNPVRNC